MAKRSAAGMGAWWRGVLLGCGIIGSAFADGGTLRGGEAIDFARDVRPILETHCTSCHGPDTQESGLRVDRRADLLRGGDFAGPAIMPHQPDASLLLRVVRGDEPELQMPPEGEPLSADEIARLSRWIAEGAVWPGPMEAAAEAEDENLTSAHWSLQPVVRPEVPAVGSFAGEPSPTDHPIDAFVRRKLSERGLAPSPEADRATLIRRLSLDLTGLPPTPEEVAAFVEDPDDTEIAYQRLVDRLLDSPRYGERWAQHWLDVIRWAETVGFETNAPRPRAWPYRDWVIRSLNEDKPYDQFLFEQLAGDTVGEDAALGFLVAGPANLPGQVGRDEESMRQARQDELDEVIRTVGQGLFGLTIDCARCHNHKFDPVTQRDYYAMQAIFAGLSYGERRWRGAENDEWTARVPEVRQRLAVHKQQLEALRQQYALQPPLENVQTDWIADRRDPERASSRPPHVTRPPQIARPPIVARAARMRILATGNRSPASLYEFEVWSAAKPAAPGANSGPAANVALAANGAVASASSFALANQTRHFDNLVDGTVDKRQAFPWVAAVGGEAWVRVDFSAPVPVERIVWHSGYSTPADYRIDLLPADADGWQTVVDSRDALPRIDDVRPAKEVELAGLTAPETAEVVEAVGRVRSTEQELARLVAGPQVYAASFAPEPPATWLLRRGDPMQRGAEVEPAVPAVLQTLVSAVDRAGELAVGELAVRAERSVSPEAERRLALVRHLIAPDHPLTSRVAVNRIWQHHFGVGLVASPADFGKMGEEPSHPELLDWLAIEFVERGWSMKQLHRLIVSSRTYRQASRPREEALAIDADSRLLWRFPPRRLEAEAIRDSVLAASGRLNLKMGGPGFDFFNQRGGLTDYVARETFDEEGWRRMIYAHKIRMQSVDVFGAFDCPDAGQMKPVRTRSITPVQSLGLLSSPFIHRQAEFFAERLQTERPEDLSAQIVRAFEIALSREPEPIEQERMFALAAEHGLPQACRALLNASEFLVIP